MADQFVRYRIKTSRLIGGWHIDKMVADTWLSTGLNRAWRWAAVRDAKRLAGPAAVLTDKRKAVYDGAMILTFWIRPEEYREVS